MRVFITRPEQDAQITAVALRAKGHTPTLVPLLTIYTNKDVSVDPTRFQAMLITSANGVRAYAAITPDRALRILTVGQASAEEAKLLGFTDIKAANGNIDALTKLTAQECTPQAGPLLHMVGAQRIGDLKILLAPHNFEVERVIAYEARAATNLPGKLAEALKKVPAESDEKNAIVFFSARTAKTFVGLVQGAALTKSCMNFKAYCLSQAVAEALTSLPFACVQIARQNTQSALLDLMELE